MCFYDNIKEVKVMTFSLQIKLDHIQNKPWMVTILLIEYACFHGNKNMIHFLIKLKPKWPLI